MKTENPFLDAFSVKMYGVLNWQQFDAHWQRIKENPQGWYVWECSDDQPKAPVEPVALDEFLAETKAFLRKRDKSGYLGFMYVDDPENATFIKLFDPMRMGSSCGCSSVAILPKWTISRVKPEPLEEEVPPPQETKSAWRRLVSAS